MPSLSRDTDRVRIITRTIRRMHYEEVHVPHLAVPGTLFHAKFHAVRRTCQASICGAAQILASELPEN